MNERREKIGIFVGWMILATALLLDGWWMIAGLLPIAVGCGVIVTLNPSWRDFLVLCALCVAVVAGVRALIPADDAPSVRVLAAQVDRPFVRVSVDGDPLRVQVCAGGACTWARKTGEAWEARPAELTVRDDGYYRILVSACDAGGCARKTFLTAPQGDR
jgi:hypothetical protein